jgi:hypothetical protein
MSTPPRASRAASITLTVDRSSPKPTLLRTRTYGKEMAMLLAAQLVNS